MDRLSKKERSILMSKIRTSGTDIELALLQCVRPLWSIERYRKNVRSLPGKPDIVFPKSKVAIFADGDFWHGRNFDKWKEALPEFWQKKIASNIVRDVRDTKVLRKMGYKVLRFWGSQIKKNPKLIRQRILSAVDML